ncbi:acyltransferase family protein [Synoicihabitans lomoniglobus]|uniref:Acyltransferase family protein n=1 Tax=Synoicihabitans lomoniglobus TaxID=2909285 RepID=A0AAF0CQS0_9BACT|nr:acyltransferase [Opitutaceae bacterium LMO-M01]WED66355.1 acyltransferase family protein [Opitutaceae bacterium LMO-M01]
MNASPVIDGFKYRPEIDGLRALAVLAVILFHAGLGLGGGYVGVDVFFVISGYLITSLILRELQIGKFRLIVFLERRLRRIMPAAVVAIFVTLVSGSFLLLPSDLEDLGYSAISQIIFSANIYFYKTTNYFAVASEEIPLLHTWSLAVEEQFYLIFPLVLMTTFKVAALRRRGPLLAIFCFGFLWSLAICVWGTQHYSTFTFFMLLTRAWELLLGAIVAVLPRLHARANFALVMDSMALVGLCAIVSACIVFNSNTPFPGIAALIPCVGAAVFIYATGHQTAPTLVSRVMSMRPLVFIGLISYSLYLLHWPLFAFTSYWTLNQAPLEIRLALVLIAFALAWLSYRYVETPFRRKSIGATRRELFKYAISGHLACLAIGVAAIMNVNYQSWLSPELLAIDSARIESRAVLANRTTLSDAKAGQLQRLGPPEPAPVSLLVWGDSLARVILPPILARAAANETAILSVWYSGSPPVRNYVPASEFSLGRDAPEFSEAVIASVKQKKIPNVLLAGWWSEYLRTAKTNGEKEAFLNSLLDTVKALRTEGAKVWLLQEVPHHQEDPLKALRIRKFLGPHYVAADWQATSQSHAKSCALLRENAARFAQAGATIIDASNYLFNNDQGVFKAEHNGLPLYYDRIHLTNGGAELIGDSFNVIFEKSISSTR